MSAKDSVGDRRDREREGEREGEKRRRERGESVCVREREERLKNKI